MKISAFTSLLGLVLLSNASFANLAQAQEPSKINIEYEVYKGDIPFATIEEQFEVKKQGYQITSLQKGSGIFALLGERVLTSQGQIEANGLVPNKFTLQQGDRLKQATFDWSNKTINMQYKGKTRTDTLTAGTQDLSSFAYQFRFKPPVEKQPYEVALTTGKKLKNYIYQVEAQTIELDGKPVDCLHLFQENSGKESKEFWVAKDYAYLPVYIVLVDKRGQRLEQTVTKFSQQ